MPQHQLMVWKKEFSVGSDSIDEQHLRIFNAINKLYSAIQERKQALHLNEILDELKIYIKVHFEEEAKELKRINYIELDKHLAEHGAFGKKIMDMIRESKVSSGDMSYDLLYFLKDWLVNHILTTDKKYVPFLAAHKN